MEKDVTKNEVLRIKDVSLARGVIIVISGFLLGAAPLLGKPSPLPFALICGLNGIECAFAAVGSVIGCMISGGAETAAVYLCAMTILSVIRFILGGRSVFIDNAIGITAGVCVCGAGFFAAETLYDIFVSAVFAVIAAVCGISAAYIRSHSETILRRGLTGRSAAAAAVLFLFVCAGFTGIQFYFFNLGTAFGAFAMLFLSENKTACAVCAIIASAGISVGSRDFAVSGVILALSAAFIALSGKFGRLFRSCTLIFTMAAGMAIVGIDRFSSSAAASCVIPAVIYFLLPEKYSCADKIIRSASYDSPLDTYAYKLENMSGAVEEIKNSIEKTAQALKNESSFRLSQISEKVSDKVCRTCSKNMTCWGSCYGDTADSMNKAVALLRCGTPISAETFIGSISRQCVSKKALAAELNRQYSAYCTAAGSAEKLSEMRGLLYSQLSATVTMLKNMSEEIKSSREKLPSCSAEMSETLKNAGFVSAHANAYRLDGKITAECYAERGPKLSADEIAVKLSAAAGAELDMPMIDRSCGNLHIVVTERTAYGVKSGIFRKSRDGREKSGDSCEIFPDGKGNIYMILSDGMGSGNRARIDSTFACSVLRHLLKAGFDPDTALEMLNSAMLVKSQDESFATVDLCKIDLNTGKVLLYKSGSASTYVRCGGSFAQIECESLPIGTSLSLSYSGKSFTLSDGDIILMTSDGAQLGYEWLSRLLLRDGADDITSLVGAVGEAARCSEESGYSDDITILGVMLTR